jgi:hypothetical protein
MPVCRGAGCPAHLLASAANILLSMLASLVHACSCFMVRAGWSPSAAGSRAAYRGGMPPANLMQPNSRCGWPDTLLDVADETNCRDVQRSATARRQASLLAQAVVVAGIDQCNATTPRSRARLPGARYVQKYHKKRRSLRNQLSADLDRHLPVLHRWRSRVGIWQAGKHLCNVHQCGDRCSGASCRVLNTISRLQIMHFRLQHIRRAGSHIHLSCCAHPRLTSRRPSLQQDAVISIFGTLYESCVRHPFPRYC